MAVTKKETIITMDMLKDELFNFENRLDSRMDLAYLIKEKGLTKAFLCNNMRVDLHELNRMLETPLYEWKLYHVMELVKLGVIDIALPEAPIRKVRALKLHMEMALLDIMEHLNTVKECESIIKDFLRETDSVLASGILSKRINARFNNTKALPKAIRRK